MGDETKNYTSKITFLLKAKERSKTGKQLKEFAAEEKTAIEERLRDHLETTASSIKEELIQKLPGKTEVVENVFSRIKQTGLSQMEDKSLGDVISSSMTEEEKNQLGAEELKKMNDVLSSSGSLKVKNLLNLNTRLQDNPILKEELRREKTIEYAGIAGLESEKITALTEKKIDLMEINETALNDLVRENLITEDQKSNIRRITQFGRLTGDDMDLVKAINVSSPVELADWDASHWLNLIESNNIPVPDDEESAKSYAENLRETVERSFPTRYFMQRVVKKADSDEITRLSESIDPLIKRSLKLFSGGAAEMESLTAADLEGIEAEKQAQIKNDFAQLKPIVNRYRHMGVGEIIDRDITVPEKQAEISRRLGALDKFYSNNKGMNLEFADFTVNLKVKKDGHRWDDIDDNIKPLVQKQMAAYQRAYMLGENYDTADILLKKGYDSAYKITSMSETDFVKDSGLGVEKGRQVYRRGGDIAAGASHSFEAFRDGTKNVFRKTPVSNQYPLVNDLKEIEGYDSMFNSQNYCECEHCRSMLGPAAYFTDLMYFIQEKISKKVFTGNYSKHPLYLKRRRPDLWKMKLTCNNTSEEIPYLDLVNETLEGYLNSELAVNDVYEELEKADWSVNQPISLSLEKLRLYLSHFDLKLPDIYKNMKAGEQKTLSEKLKLSPEELRIITKDDPSCDDAGTLKRFGQSDLNEFNVQKFIGYAGITRSELDDLLKTSFYPEISQIKISSISDNSDIQKSYEVIDNLTGSILDLIHRYLRLWKKTPWNIREYDLLLTSMQNAGLLKKLEDKTGEGYPKILGLAQWKTIQDALKLTVEELASVIHQLPEKPIADNVKSFAVRTFDPEKIAGLQLNEKIPQVLAGLGITQAELLILLDLLGIDQAASIDIGILSKLFRQARIAKSLKMKAEDFHNAASLVLKKDLPENADDIEKMVEFTAWLKKSSLKMPEIAFILTGKENTSNKYKIDEETIAAKILEIQEKDYEGLGDAAGGKTQKMQEYLKEYLLSKFNLTEDLLDLEFPQANFDNASTQALAATFTNEEPDNPDVFNELLGNVHQLERYALLFSKHRFSNESISYAFDQMDAFGIDDFRSLTVENIKNISLYRDLLLENDEIEEKLQKTLTGYQAESSFASYYPELAELWQESESLIKSLSENLTLTKPALSAMREMWSALKICQKLGIQGDSLNKLACGNYSQAGEIALGAFKSKYNDEATRKEKLEPYNDKINTLKRDALCDYIISRYDKFKFEDREDLYSFFLLSIDMGGCARTSRLTAAHASLQLYVHRCLASLEQSDVNLNPNIPDVSVLPSYIPEDEWEWRKNYRVWEANRKVFLYPENYTEPSLRDTKTDIFKEIEDELLQQKITKQSAESAYKKYISRFSELAKLRYAGAYYNQVYDNYGYVNLKNTLNPVSNVQGFFLVSSVHFPMESDDSCYYLFARTNVQPYQYYYRTYNNYHKTWGNWTKIEIGIEAREISALIHQGRLYIFWTEVKSKEISKFSEKEFKSSGYVFKVYLKYSSLDENGKWSAPQRLFVGNGQDTEENIYKRVRNAGFDADKWEKEKDFILESYEEKVFRKPYTYINYSNTSTPVGLSYIWTNGVHNKKVIYRTLETSKEGEYKCFKYKLEFQPQSFTIDNDDFTDAEIQIPVLLSLSYHGDYENYEILSQAEIECTMQLADGICYLKIPDSTITEIISVESTTITEIIPVESTTVPNSTEAGFNLSLSRNVIVDQDKVKIFSGGPLNVYKDEYSVGYLENGVYAAHIESGSSSLMDHFIQQLTDGSATMQVLKNNNYSLINLSTIMTDELADILYAKGIEEFLSAKTQQMTNSAGEQLDFEGPYGVYYWELFYHLPALIAFHLNANQKFKEAKWWYERIFNPTAGETEADTDHGDYYWQFSKFKGLTTQKLKDMLADSDAIEAYKEDPFDPHAIARLRISAYQKWTVMQYISNLLDWGDYLFTQDTRESINEAEMLYQLAHNILGKEPVRMGKCTTADESRLTYEEIGPNINENSEFLITLENFYWINLRTYHLERDYIKSTKRLSARIGLKTGQVDIGAVEKLASIKKVSDLVKIANFQGRALAAEGINTINVTAPMALVKSVSSVKKEKAAIKARNVKMTHNGDTASLMKDFSGISFKAIKHIPSLDIVRQCSVFCVPENKNLLEYWDRVNNRLGKIWNCMNIKGIRRSLSLYSPEIEPMLLVRLKASGLSLEDVLASLTAVTSPKYRFVYMLEKAKQFTQTVQGFGSALLSAMEKKDGEELTLLRAVHEKNILNMTKETKKNQIKEQKALYDAAEEGLKNVENRIDYFTSLIESGLNSWEVTEQVSRKVAAGIRLTEATLGFMASISGYLPQVGSPFAMKYGGHELKNGLSRFADATGCLAVMADNVGIMAGIEAGNQRREQEWKQQLKLATQEYKQMNKQLAAAEIRQLIAERDLEIHEKNIEQTGELYDFYKNKFTGMSLYNFMSSSLNRVYREAYDMAYELAKSAEQAYQNETFATDVFIQPDNWQFDRAGLLAADMLMQQLHAMEKSYMENNSRTPEITQSFSLALLNPQELINLRQTGSCSFKIPEIAFDVQYPGQYRRVIKTVRMTIPCVTGPFTNVSARLTLTGSTIRKEENGNPEDRNVAVTSSITSSSANNDTGMFEFNFRDERYLPFEGAGAVSAWLLELPSKLRSFNYDGISDVILQVSYTALEGNIQAAETNIENLIQEYSADSGLFRLFSLKYEFGNALDKLITQNGQSAQIQIEKKHFPYIFLDEDLILNETIIYLKPKAGCEVTVPDGMVINNVSVTWSDAEDIAYAGAEDGKNKIKGGTVALAGSPVTTLTIAPGAQGLDTANLEDVLILVKYGI